MFEKDTDAYAKDRDERVMESAREAGVKVIVKSGRTLWDSDEIVKANGGKPTMSSTQLQNAGAKVGDIERPIDAPTSLPDPGDMELDIEQTKPEPEPDFNAKYRDSKEYTYGKGIAGPNGDYSVPSLKELGMPAATSPHRGGETVVLKMLDETKASVVSTGA